MEEQIAGGGVEKARVSRVKRQLEIIERKLYLLRSTCPYSSD